MIVQMAGRYWEKALVYKVDENKISRQVISLFRIVFGKRGLAGIFL